MAAATTHTNGDVLVILAGGGEGRRSTNSSSESTQRRGCVQYKHIADVVMTHASDVPLNDVHVVMGNTTANTDEDKKKEGEEERRMDGVKRVLILVREECSATELTNTVKEVPDTADILVRKYLTRNALTQGGHTESKKSSVRTLALLAGLEPLAATAAAGGASGVSGEYDELWVKKPKFTVGSAMKITRKKPKTLPAPVLVKVDDEDDDALVDEDALLTEEDRALPTPMAVDDGGCAPRRKACANCSCGRRDAELAEEEMLRSSRQTKVQLTQDLTDEQINNPQSACGSCGLGDAYRCSTCPYLGMPNFPLGEKISIGESMLAADI